MTFLDWITSTIGTTALIGAVLWFCRSWIITRLKLSISYEYDKKLEDHKDKLKKQTECKLIELKSNVYCEVEKEIIKIKQFSPKQFELYNNLWKSLYDLKISLRDFMYYLRDEEKLKIFEEKLAKASNIVQENAIIIDEEHYTKLAEIINCFGTCETNGTFIMADRKNMPGNPEVIKLLITNQQLQEKLHEELDAFMKVLRKKILG